MPETVELAPFQKRLLAEHEQLSDRVAKLSTFVKGDKFQDLDEANQGFMQDQLDAMVNYLSVLTNRLALQGVDGAELPNKVAFDHIQSMVDSLEFKFARVEETTVTGCWAFLPNGFQVAYGESACVDPNSFDFELGKKYAKERCVQAATNKLWELEGYLLANTGVTSDYL